MITRSLKVVKGTSLIPGIRILFPSRVGEEARQLIQLSSGIALGGTLYPSFDYKDESYVPRPPWRQPTEGELLALKRGPVSQEEPGSCVRLLHLPSDALRLINESRQAAKLSSLEELLRYFNDSSASRPNSLIGPHISMVTGVPASAMEGLKVTVKLPRLPTTTSDLDARLIGLHIDSWVPTSLYLRKLSPYRFAANIGKSDRYLTFINLSVQQICSTLRSAGEDVSPDESGTHRVRQAFMRRFSYYPVVRLLLRPGDAYIAPTENFIHDGSSIDSDDLDLLLTFRHPSLREAAEYNAVTDCPRDL